MTTVICEVNGWKIVLDEYVHASPTMWSVFAFLIYVNMLVCFFVITMQPIPDPRWLLTAYAAAILFSATVVFGLDVGFIPTVTYRVYIRYGQSDVISIPKTGTSSDQEEICRAARKLAIIARNTPSEKSELEMLASGCK